MHAQPCHGPDGHGAAPATAVYHFHGDLIGIAIPHAIEVGQAPVGSPCSGQYQSGDQAVHVTYFRLYDPSFLAPAPHPLTAELPHPQVYAGQKPDGSHSVATLNTDLLPLASLRRLLTVWERLNEPDGPVRLSEETRGYDPKRGDLID